MPMDVTRGIDALFFDLDDCIYRKETRAHVWVRHRIAQQVAEHLSISPEEAHAVTCTSACALKVLPQCSAVTVGGGGGGGVPLLLIGSISAQCGNKCRRMGE